MKIRQDSSIFSALASLASEASIWPLWMGVDMSQEGHLMESMTSSVLSSLTSPTQQSIFPARFLWKGTACTPYCTMHVFMSTNLTYLAHTALSKLLWHAQYLGCWSMVTGIVQNTSMNCLKYFKLYNELLWTNRDFELWTHYSDLTLLL